MIEKIYELSEIFDDGSPVHLKISQIPGRETGFAIILDLDKRSLESVEPIDVKKSDAKKYLFRQAKGNLSVSPSPTINLTKDLKKLKKTIDKFINFFNDPLTRDIHSVLVENREAIIDDLQKEEKILEKSILTIKFVKDGQELYPADLENVVELFLKRNIDADGNKKSNRCFLCGREVESYPVLSEIFKFASFDKPGFTPALSKDPSGVISICKDCRIKLEYGRNIISEKLSFEFFGDTLWIIPSGEKKAVKRIVTSLERGIYESEELRYFSRIERLVEERLSKEESVSYDFVVLSISQNAEKILLMINDVSPSRLSKMMEVAGEIKEDFYVDPTLGVVYQIFRDFGKKPFYELVRCLYTGEIFSKYSFFSYVMSWIRRQMFEDEVLNSIRRTGRIALAVYLYLRRLEVLKGGKGMNWIFKKYDEFFDHPWKKAVFMTGALVSYIMNYQKLEHGSTPFAKKLKGLKMKKEDIENLFSEVKAKAIQYKIEDEDFERAYETAGKAFMEAGNWRAGIDEINFVFSVGMAMSGWIFGRRESDEEE